MAAGRARWGRFCERPTSVEEDIEALLAECEAAYPDSVDEFEDELLRRLGCERHPSFPYDAWRRRRVELINAAGDRADEVAARLEDELLGS